MSPWDGSVSPETESAQIFGKRFRSPIINNINSCSVHEIHAVHGGGGGGGGGPDFPVTGSAKDI